MAPQKDSDDLIQIKKIKFGAFVEVLSDLFAALMDAIVVVLFACLMAAMMRDFFSGPLIFFLEELHAMLIHALSFKLGLFYGVRFFMNLVGY